jgi:hypothetical protein
VRRRDLGVQKPRYHRGGDLACSPNVPRGISGRNDKAAAPTGPQTLLRLWQGDRPAQGLVRA